MSKSMLLIETPTSCWDCPCLDGEYGECQVNKTKVSIEDYVLDNCPLKPYKDAIPIELYEQVKGERDVAIEQLKALNIELFEKPYRKAIPIEWIKKEMKRLDDDIKWAWYYGNVALDKMEYLKMWLTIKLEEWEKENEID